MAEPADDSQAPDDPEQRPDESRPAEEPAGAGDQPGGADADAASAEAGGPVEGESTEGQSASAGEGEGEEEGDLYRDRAEDEDAYDGYSPDEYGEDYYGDEYDYGEDYDYESEQWEEDQGEDEDGEWEYVDEADEGEDEDGEWEYVDEEEEQDEDEDEDGMRKMTLVEHLDELRMRIIRAVIGLAVGMGIALALSPQIIDILCAPFHEIAKAGQANLVTTGHIDPFLMYLKMALYVGIIISAPWLFYQIWMFISAGLYSHERRYVKLAVPFSAGLFIIGALFFLVYISPLLLGFFYVFSTKVMGVKPMITLQKHITFMTNMMLVFGICFQMPIAVLLLGKMGLVTVKTLNRYRKHVIVAILIIAAFTTSPSPLDQIALAIPMWMLYELGVVLVYFLVERKRRKEEEAEAAEEAAEAELYEDYEEYEDGEEYEYGEEYEDEGEDQDQRHDDTMAGSSEYDSAGDDGSGQQEEGAQGGADGETPDQEETERREG